MLSQSDPSGDADAGASKRPRWLQALTGIYTRINDDHVSVVAAGVAFFGLLALFPAMAALLSLAALAVDPVEVAGQMDEIASALPADAAKIIQAQGQEIVSGTTRSLGVAALIALLLSFYSASKGLKTLIEGMNIAYREREKRGFIHLNLLAIGLTFLITVGLLIALTVVMVIPILLDYVGISDIVRNAVDIGRWVVMAAMSIFGLTILYRYGPSHRRPRWRWATPGAAVATVVWIAASAAFSAYVRHFGNYNETYGALGGVIILLTWLWLSAFIVLLGAEVDSELHGGFTEPG